MKVSIHFTIHVSGNCLYFLAIHSILVNFPVDKEQRVWFKPTPFSVDQGGLLFKDQGAFEPQHNLSIQYSIPSLDTVCFPLKFIHLKDRYVKAS